MKQVIVTMVFLTIYNLIAGQDILIKKDGSEIKGIVTEIGNDNVLYKDFNDQNGTTQQLFKKELFLIIYENGEKEKFNMGNIDIPVSSTSNENRIENRLINSITINEIRRIKTSGYGVSQNLIQHIKSSDNEEMFSFYTYDKGQHYYGYHLYDIPSNKFISLKCKTSFNTGGSFLQAFGDFAPNSSQYYTILENYIQFYDVRDGSEIYHYAGGSKPMGGRNLYKISLSNPGLYYDEEIEEIQTFGSYLYNADNNTMRRLSTQTDLETMMMTGKGTYILQTGKDMGEMVFYEKKNLVACNSGIFPKKIFLCDVSTGQLIHQLEEPPKALLYTKMRFSNDGKYLLAILGKSILVWDTKTGRLVHTIDVHQKTVFDFDISSTNIMVTASLDETIKLWDIDNNFREVLTIHPLNDKGKYATPNYIFFTTNGKRLATLTFNNELIVWDLKVNYSE